MTRRLLVWALGLCMLPTWAATPPCRPQALEPVAPGVWAWPAIDQDLHASNQGHIISNVVLLTDDGVTVIDPGPHHAHGDALRAAIDCQLQRPVVAVWNSHAHAENTLGNGAFSVLGIPIKATAATQTAMRQRCPSCLQHMIDTLDPSATEGTHIVLPDHVWSGGDGWQSLASNAGQWQIRAFARAHSESDLVWWDARHRTLIAAGLVYQRRLPELAQGSLRGWIAALDVLLQLQPQVVVGQRVGDIQDVRATRDYLCGLNNAVLKALERGETASQVSRIEQPDFQNWTAYDTRQGFNTQRAWRELEGAWMSGSSPHCPLN